MRTSTRVAIVAGVVLFLGAIAATFLPTSPQGASCGTWLSPEWTDGRVRVLVEGGRPEVAVAAQRLCDDALGTRRTATLVLLGLAVVLPAGVVFVGRGRSSA